MDIRIGCADIGVRVQCKDSTRSTYNTFWALCRRVAQLYRVTLVVEYLSWVDLDLGSSSGWLAANVATYCPSRMVEHPKSKSTQPKYSPPRI